MVVCAIIERVAGRYRTARIDVLVGAVKIRVHRRILHRQSVAEIVLDHRQARLNIRIGIVVDRAAEKCREIAVRRER